MQDSRLSFKWFLLSSLIAGLAVVASLLGIFYPATYEQETANWAMQARGQDVGNLIAALLLLLSLLFFNKKNRFALLVWLGALLYFVYAYLVYSFAVHFNYLFLVYVTVLGLSIYSVIGVLIDNRMAIENVKKGYSAKFASTVLIGTGTIFLLLWLSDIVPAVFKNRAPESFSITELWVNPIHVIDLSMVLPGMILTGAWLWQKKAAGYFLAVPWLVFSILMGSSIVATMIMDLQLGNSAATVPLVLVGAIVVVSLFAVIPLLKKVS